jgi:hypothetical protein
VVISNLRIVNSKGDRAYRHNQFIKLSPYDLDFPSYFRTTEFYGFGFGPGQNEVTTN